MNYFETFKLRQRKPGDAGALASRFLESLSLLVGRPEQFRLVQLWRNWSIVMGEEISSLCLPLGHRARRLDVGTEDSMAMQELLYLKEEIRLRANSFMEEDFFAEVKLELVAERKGLAAAPQGANGVRNDGWNGGRLARHEVPLHATGVYLADMPEDDPVARCYRAWCGDSPGFLAKSLPGKDTRDKSSSSGACDAHCAPGAPAGDGNDGKALTACLSDKRRVN